MGGFGSGRPSEPGPDPALALPLIGETEEQVQAFVQAVATAQVTPRTDGEPGCMLSARLADSLDAKAQTTLRAIRQRQEAAAEEELRAMYEQVQRDLGTALAFESAARMHSSCPTCGRGVDGSPGLSGTWSDDQLDAGNKKKRAPRKAKGSAEGKRQVRGPRAKAADPKRQKRRQ